MFREVVASVLIYAFPSSLSRYTEPSDLPHKAFLPCNEYIDDRRRIRLPVKRSSERRTDSDLSLASKSPYSRGRPPVSIHLRIPPPNVRKGRRF